MIIKDLKRKLAKEGHNFVPELREEVYQSVGYQKRSKTFNHFNPRLIMSFALLIMVIISFDYIMMSESTSNSFLFIEINPGIELEVSQDEVVINASYLNPDGYFLLEKINLTHMKLDVAIVLIVDEAINQGYLQVGEKKVRAVAVNKNSRLEGKINERVKEVLESYIPGILNSDDELIKKANEHNITPGKMLIINKALAIDSTLAISQVLKMDNQALLKLINNHAESNIKKFKDQYQNNLSQLERDFNNQHNEIIQKKAIIENHLDALVKSLPNVKDIDKFLNKIDNFFPEFQYDRSEITELIDLLQAIEAFYDDYFNFYEELIEDNFKSKREAYRSKVNENINNDKDDFSLDFEDKFWLDDYAQKFDANEKAIIRLINRIKALMISKSQNANRKIDDLYQEYLVLIDEAFSDFKNSDIILKFQEEYQNYQINKKR